MNSARPDLAVLLDEIHEQIAEHLDVVRLVAQRVAEHLADAGKLVLPVEREDHAEQAVELRAFHALAEDEDVFREQLLVLGQRQVESRRRSLETRVTNSFLRTIVGTSSNIASHSCGLMPSEEIM